MLLLVFTGLPVASVVCARECTAPTETSAADTDASEHCHKVEATDAATINPLAPDGCSLLALRDVATRERGAAPLGSSRLVTDQHVGTTLEPLWIASAKRHLTSLRPSTAPSLSAPLPLRI